jgi:hypothetical protein
MPYKERGMSIAILIDMHYENSNGLISPVHTGKKDRRVEGWATKPSAQC